MAQTLWREHLLERSERISQEAIRQICSAANQVPSLQMTYSKKLQKWILTQEDSQSRSWRLKAGPPARVPKPAFAASSNNPVSVLPLSRSSLLTITDPWLTNSTLPLVMGLLSTSPASSPTPTAPTPSTDGAYIAPDRIARAHCWTARDNFFLCLERNGIVDSIREKEKADSACGAEDKEFGKECAKSWVRREFRL